MVKTYAVNCNDAWLMRSDDPKEGTFVKYEDYEKLKADRDYWYEKCLNAGVLDGEDMARDQEEQAALLDKWYETGENPN